MSTTDTAVRDLLQRWAAAELAGDAAAFDDLLAPGFTAIGPAGFVLDAAGWAGRYHGDVVNDAFEIQDPHLSDCGDTVIVEAVQRQQTTARGHRVDADFRVGLVAVRQDGTWRLARIQLSGPLLAQGARPSFAR